MRFVLGLTATVLVFLLVGCDATSTDPLLPTQAIFRLTDVTSDESIFVEILGDRDLRKPDEVRSDTLELVRGRTYEGRIEFYNADGENITYALQENAEVIEVGYGFSGVPPLQLTVTDTENTYGAERNGVDLPVGLTFDVAVPNDTPIFSLGAMDVQVLEYAPGEKGASSETTYWSQFSIPIIVSRPGPRQPSAIERVTGLNLRLELEGNGSSIGFSDADGLQNGTSLTLDRLQLEGHETYTGYLRLDGLLNSTVERELTAKIREEGVWYLVEYTYLNADQLLLQELAITDTDVDGQPLGLEFELRAFGAGRITFDLGIQVYAYAANSSKLDAQPDRRLIVDVAIPLSVL
ncbi:MAG: hypothetical protein RhofKO_14040 [Rhodothermales bacterium]